jgi:hypothetical protein
MTGWKGTHLRFDPGSKESPDFIRRQRLIVTVNFWQFDSGSVKELPGDRRDADSSRKQCYRLLYEMQMPDHIVAHSLQVCRVAALLAENLKMSGMTLHRDLIVSFRASS